MLKLDLVLAVAALIGGALWIEQGHRIVIEAPAAPATSQAAAICPDNDTVPYSASCLDYLKVAEPVSRLQVRMTDAPAAPAPCPDNDKQPYSASCLAYLKGATESGMQWRVTETPNGGVGPK
jgi:hypothetical protein